jgi:tRNA(His) guanylyltransferase
MKDSLGDRMKSYYEEPWRIQLPGRTPIIVRLDGCSFSQYTKSCKKPFDDNVAKVMNTVAAFLCKKVQGCQIAYTQSDEVSLLLVNYQTHETQPYLDRNLQKIASITAGMASTIFYKHSNLIFGECRDAWLDSRAFTIPKEEVNNYFLWRQQDARRNSLSMLAQSLYSPKELHKKNSSELQKMCLAKGQDWNNLDLGYQRGRCIVKTINPKEILNKKTQEKIIIERSEWVVDNKIPIFSENSNYIEQYVNVGE